MNNSVMDKIENELNKVFDDLNSKWVKVSFILSKLNLSLIEQRTSTFTPESLIKLYLYRRIKGIHFYERLIGHLEKNNSDAYNLGFFKDTKFPTKRNFNKFFQKHKDTKLLLNNITKEILKIATEKRKVLDIELVKKEINNHNKKLEQIKKLREASKLVKRLVYPQVDIKIKENGKFTTKDLLDVLVHVAYSHDFTTNGSLVFQELNQDKNIPSGDLMLYHFSKFNSIKKIREMFISIFDVIFEFSKKNYKLLSKRKVNIAYDIHKIPYYGDKNDVYVKEGKPDRGTSHFYEFLTCSIVTNGYRFVIDAIPVHALDNLSELLDKSLVRVKDKIRIDKAYFDRGFDRPKIIDVINKNSVKFIMPKIRSNTIKSWMKKSEDCKSRIIHDFKIGNSKANLILVDDKENIKRAFIINFDIPLQLTHYLFKFYSKRWGIETSYRNLDHDFKARTTSKNYCIRLFYFLFSVCLYNLWVLVNICVSILLYNRVSNKPLISAKLFAVVLCHIVYEDPPT